MTFSGPPRSLGRARRRLATIGLASLCSLGALAFAQDAMAQVSFKAVTQLSGTSGLTRPTAMQWGPDGKLYVAEQYGKIRVYTIARSGGTSTTAGSYAVTGTETITSVEQIQNHDDNGSVATAGTALGRRLITGITMTGTAATPVIYVVSSDPRIGAGESGTDPNGNDLNLDTNSGILSRLTRSGTTWTKQDLVRGLPRSEENHTGNGTELSADGNTLYIAQGGNTNKGAPSKNFATLPEYALSGAILSVNLASAAVQAGYDLPTLQNTATPWGGQDGANMSRLVAGGPVQVWAPGFRNPYDILRRADGTLWTIDNGGNAGWGDTPLSCANGIRNGGTSDNDTLHKLSQGYFGGHPNPVRGNPTAAGFAGAVDASLIDAQQCTYVDPESKAFADFPTSTNALAEYTASNFGGELQGQILATGFNNKVYSLDTGATSATVAQPFPTAIPSTSVGGTPLALTTQGDSGAFPGTVWVGDVANNGLYIYEPADFGGTAPPVCNPANPAGGANGDADADGYTNADEATNGTNPCSAASVPPDTDGDKISDRLDPDDDNDGTSDLGDPFQVDAANGLNTALPVDHEWENEGASDGGLLGLGFTGMMVNGATNYLDMFDTSKMTIRGAGGIFTVDQVDPGDAFQGANTQKYAFQLGINARPSVGTFTAHTRVVNPFAAQTPQNFQSMGLFVGTGDQNNYVKVTAAMANQTGVQAVGEVAGATTARFSPTPLPGPTFIDLYLTVDPTNGLVQASYTPEGGTRTVAGEPFTVPASWFTAANRGLAVGLISTSTGGAVFPATWDNITVTKGGTVPASGGTTPPATQPPPPAPPAQQDPGTPQPPATPPAVQPQPVTPTTPSIPGPTTAAGDKDATAPALKGVRLDATKLRTLAVGQVKAGSSVRLQLTEDAKVRVTVQKKTTGRLVDGACVKSTSENSTAAACTRYVSLKGAITKELVAGTQTIRFTGTIGGNRLAPGSYRLVVTATDAAGNVSAKKRVTFRVIT